jgi:hypothetical protein
MNRYAVNLSLEVNANPRFANLNLREVRNGCRIIGGDKGDIHFQGYTTGDGRTELSSAELVTGLELTSEEAQEIAEQVLQFSFESIGIETVEHS